MPSFAPVFTARRIWALIRLVPKSVTLNDLERRNGRVLCIIPRIW